MLDLSALDRKLKAARSLPPPRQRRARREAAGATQEDLALPLGVHRETISRWERGERTPRGDLLIAYVELLDRLGTNDS